ncbi:MAG: hypothetical protein ACO2PO_20045 [Candidatus Calescibacterium sp.]
MIKESKKEELWAELRSSIMDGILNLVSEKLTRLYQEGEITEREVVKKKLLTIFNKMAYMIEKGEINIKEKWGEVLLFIREFNNFYDKVIKDEKEISSPTTSFPRIVQIGNIVIHTNKVIPEENRLAIFKLEENK